MGSWMSPPGRKANWASSMSLCFTIAVDKRSAKTLWSSLLNAGPTVMGRISSVSLTKPSDFGSPVMIPSFSNSGMSPVSRLRFGTLRTRVKARFGS